MASVTNGTQTKTPPSTAPQPLYPPEASDKGAGWIMFAAIMFLLTATMNVIWGIAAVASSGFFVAGASYILLTDLTTWGWIVIGIGALEFLAAFSIIRGGAFGRWFGILIAGLAAIGALLTMPAYPFWGLVLVAIDILVIYALAAYGGKPELLD